MRVLTSLVILTVGLTTARRQLPKELEKEIQGYQDDVTRIIDHVSDSSAPGGRHEAWNRLAYLTDVYGARSPGSTALEASIDYLKGEFEKEFGEENVMTEDVTITAWTRDPQEYAEVIMEGKDGYTRAHRMYIMGIVTSVATPPEGVTGQLMVVRSFDELHERCNEAQDKIVVFNQPWTNYMETYQYRSWGANETEKCNAKAVLVRSLTPYSIYSPHTGSQTKPSNVPAACITVEDAEMMQRFSDRGQTLTGKLVMRPTTRKAQSRNLIAQIKGTTYPEQYVVFGGHIDSHDVGVGAMDDGGGVIISWQALTIIKQLGLKPKRTMRAVLWTAEEIGWIGAKSFYENHKNDEISLLMESDAGTFTPTGLGFQGSGMAGAIMEDILYMLGDINATKVTDFMGGTIDLIPWKTADKVYNTAALNNVDDEYFKYHHTEGDSMLVIDPDELDKCAILWAAVSYVVASLDQPLPTEGDYPPPLDVSTAPVTMTSSVTVPALLLLGMIMLDWLWQ